jgi:hypothetical protein
MNTIRTSPKLDNLEYSFYYSLRLYQRLTNLSKICIHNWFFLATVLVQASKVRRNMERYRYKYYKELKKLNRILHNKDIRLYSPHKQLRFFRENPLLVFTNEVGPETRA